MIDQRVVARFWSKVDKSGGPDACWPWLAHITRKGYGAFKFNGRAEKSNRMAYLLHFGVDPGELHVLHRCDNRRCCNPAHLWLGTNADNAADRVAKGRTFNGKRLITHCPRGHPYDEENTVIHSGGLRGCRICRRAASIRATNALRLRRKQMRNAKPA